MELHDFKVNTISCRQAAMIFPRHLQWVHFDPRGSSPRLLHSSNEFPQDRATRSFSFWWSWSWLCVHMPLACLQKPGIAAGHFFGGNPVGDPSTPFLRAWIPATFPLHQSIDPANPRKPLNTRMVHLSSLQRVPFDPQPCCSFGCWMMMREKCISPRTGGCCDGASWGRGCSAQMGGWIE